jgi:hypothetical protein
MDDVFAFCGQIPSLDQLCQAAGIETPAAEEELWHRLIDANYLETMPFWIEGDASQRATRSLCGRSMARLDTARLRFYFRSM